MGIFDFIGRGRNRDLDADFSWSNEGDRKERSQTDAAKPRYSYNESQDLQPFYELNGVKYRLEQINSRSERYHSLSNADTQAQNQLQAEYDYMVSQQRAGAQERIGRLGAKFLPDEEIFVLGEDKWTIREYALEDGKTFESRIVRRVIDEDKSALKSDMAAGGPVAHVYGDKKFIEGPPAHFYINEGTKEEPIVPTSTDVIYVRFGNDKDSFYKKEISTKLLDQDGNLHTHVTVVNYSRDANGKISEAGRINYKDNLRV